MKVPGRFCAAHANTFAVDADLTEDVVADELSKPHSPEPKLDVEKFTKDLLRKSFAGDLLRQRAAHQGASSQISRSCEFK